MSSLSYIFSTFLKAREKVMQKSQQAPKYYFQKGVLNYTAQLAIVKQMTGRNRAAQLAIVKQMSRH